MFSLWPLTFTLEDFTAQLLIFRSKGPKEKTDKGTQVTQEQGLGTPVSLDVCHCTTSQGRLALGREEGEELYTELQAFCEQHTPKGTSLIYTAII